MKIDGPLFDRYLPVRAFPGERSVVYLCADLQERRPVALRKFHEHLALGGAREALLRGCADWIRIGRHPHLVEAREVRHDATIVAVASEFVEPLEGARDASLSGLMRAPLALGSACWIALGIARGMKHAVARLPGLVHGELSPDNILVGRDRRARVCGFGLSGLTNGEHGATSRPFAAPERIDGRFDGRADLYSFGQILLASILGDGCAPGLGTLGEATPDCQAVDPEHARRAALPAPLVPLVTSCVHPSPEARPADWASVERMLTAAWPDLFGKSAPEPDTTEQAERAHRLLEGWARGAIAAAHCEHGALAEAIETYEHVVRIAREEQELAMEADALTGAGKAMYAVGDLDQAATTLVRAMELKRDLRDFRGQAAVLVAIGDVCAEQSNADEALAAYFAAARLFAEQGDRRGSATARLHMAPVLDGAGRPSEARNAADESRALFEEAGDVKGEGLAWSAQARLQRGSGSLEESLVSSAMAVDRSNACGDTANAARELSLHAQTLRAMDRMPDAIDQYAQAVRVSELAGDTMLRADNLMAMATLMIGTPGAAKGQACAKLAAALYRTKGREDLAADAERLASQYDA